MAWKGDKELQKGTDDGAETKKKRIGEEWESLSRSQR